MNGSCVPECIFMDSFSCIEYYSQQHGASDIRISSFREVRDYGELLLTVHNSSVQLQQVLHILPVTFRHFLAKPDRLRSRSSKSLSRNDKDCFFKKTRIRAD